MTFFNFKLLHCLIPVKRRIHEILHVIQIECKLCSSSRQETILHAFHECPYDIDVFSSLMKVSRIKGPKINESDLLCFAFDDLSEEEILPVMFFVSSFLLEIWSRRIRKEKLNLYEIRTTIEAKCNLLRETRFTIAEVSAKDMLKYL